MVRLEELYIFEEFEVINCLLIKFHLFLLFTKIFNFALDVNSKDIFQDNVLKNINKKYKIVTFVYNHHIKPIYVNRFYVLNVEIYVIQQKIAKFNKKSNQKILKVFAKNAKNLDIHKMNVLLFKLNHFKKIKKI